MIFISKISLHDKDTTIIVTLPLITRASHWMLCLALDQSD